MAKQPWKPWHEVVKLRDDLRSGDLPLHMFAADLYEVMMQNGKRPIYERPEEFFALTFPTHNLRGLVRDLATACNRSDQGHRSLRRPDRQTGCHGRGAVSQELSLPFGIDGGILYQVGGGYRAVSEDTRGAANVRPGTTGG